MNLELTNSGKRSVDVSWVRFSFSAALKEFSFGLFREKVSGQMKKDRCRETD
jgi:hypothetical protein